MSTIVEAEVPAAEFALGATLAALPDVEFDIERVAAHSSSHIVPYVWVEDADEDTLEDALADDDSVADADLLTVVDGKQLYRMDWVGHIELAVHVLTEEDGTIIDAHGRDRTWLLRVLFPGREEVSRTNDYAVDHGLTFDVKSINGMEKNRSGRFGLTEQQYEAITAALEHGYYEIPRDASAEDLAGEIGISRQAFAERLRRGHRTLADDALTIGLMGPDNRT
ncbi:DNA-binding protein [Halobacteriales archaeon QS_8_65_32]|jgi:predicted DNA binding protein|nr:MAG: DNA-binding protein [Halobacteriales archaeon QS_8_65_32]